MVNKTLGRTLRCTGLAVLALGLLVFAVPETAEAGTCTPGLHGVGIFKSCVSPKNSCATDADCSDGVFCNGEEQCATEGSPGANVVDCTITLQNPEIHCDSVDIVEIADAIILGNGAPTSSSALLVTGTTGTTSGPGCDVGDDVGAVGAEFCNLSPGATISVRANYYTVNALDASPLADQATGTTVDQCDAPGGSEGCSATPSNVQFTASTTLQSGCSPGTPVDCPSDGNACNGTEFCNETTDMCDSQNAPPPCADPTCEVCDETSGLCVPISPLPDVCTPGDEVCRTPGFWGTHADADPDKECSQNITQAVLDVVGSISICGEDICNTLVDDASSAIEAMCVRVQGQPTRQLARQLTAARLNCIISGEVGGACDGISINDVFDACNTRCAGGFVSATLGSDTFNCIDALDCFNNGGVFDLADEICTTGACATGGAACGPETPCANLSECVPFPSNCHDAAFPDAFDFPNDLLPSSNECFEKQGPAGSSDECKEANKTACTVIQPNEDECDTADACAP
jgi:hypothetical protein